MDNTQKQGTSVLIQNQSETNVGKQINRWADTVDLARKKPSTSSPSIQMCAPGWSQCRSQVAHPFPSATPCGQAGRSPGPAAWQQPFVKFSYSQIPYRIIRSQRATNPRSVHPAIQVYHRSRLLSPTGDSPCSFNPHLTTQRNSTGCSADGSL